MSPLARAPYSASRKRGRLGRGLPRPRVDRTRRADRRGGAGVCGRARLDHVTAQVRLTVFSPTDAGRRRHRRRRLRRRPLAERRGTQPPTSALSPEAGYKPFFNNPTAPTFVPGPNGGAPGLVVLLSTTPTTPGTPFQGPKTNLAGLFQINGVGTVKGGLTQTWNTWQIGKAGFGSGPSMLTAYVVKGTAPALIPDAGLELISNRVTVPFTASALLPARARAGGQRQRHGEGDDQRRPRRDPGRHERPHPLPVRAGPGHDQHVCTGACANVWPALKAQGTPTAGAGLDAAKIGSANGQVTYAGHLLYSYSGDAKPGDTIGASIPSWAAVSPTGAGDPRELRTPTPTPANGPGSFRPGAGPRSWVPRALRASQVGADQSAMDPPRYAAANAALTSAGVPVISIRPCSMIPARSATPSTVVGELLDDEDRDSLARRSAPTSRRAAPR